MSPPRQHQQSVKLIQELLRSALLYYDAFAFSPVDFSLNRILMKIREQLFDGRTEIQGMERETLGDAKARGHPGHVPWAHLEVLQFAGSPARNKRQQFLKFFVTPNNGSQ